MNLLLKNNNCLFVKLHDNDCDEINDGLLLIIKLLVQLKKVDNMQLLVLFKLKTTKHCKIYLSVKILLKIIWYNDIKRDFNLINKIRCILNQKYLGNDLYTKYYFIDQTLKYIKHYLNIDNLKLNLNYEENQFKKLMCKIKNIIFNKIDLEYEKQYNTLINNNKLNKNNLFKLVIKNKLFIIKKWILLIEKTLNPYEKSITIKFILKNFNYIL